MVRDFLGTIDRLLGLRVFGGNALLVALMTMFLLLVGYLLSSYLFFYYYTNQGNN